MAPFARQFNTVTGATLKKKHHKGLSHSSSSSATSPHTKRFKVADLITPNSSWTNIASESTHEYKVRVQNVERSKEDVLFQVDIKTPLCEFHLKRSIADILYLEHELRLSTPYLVLPPAPKFKLSKRRSFIKAISKPLTPLTFSKKDSHLAPSAPVSLPDSSTEIIETWLINALYCVQNAYETQPWIDFLTLREGDIIPSRTATPIVRRIRSDNQIGVGIKSSRSSLPASFTSRRKYAPSIKLDDFSMLKVLGQGCMGKVLLVQHKKDSGQLYAMKAIHKKQVLVSKELVHTLQEQRILRDTTREGGNPFLIKLFYSFHDLHNLYLVLEYHPGGDLAMQLARDGRLGPDRSRFYAAEIFDGVQGLHRCGIIYRDLKPENILIGHDGHIVLTDFGLSKQFVSEANGSTTSTFCGTAEYLAPEILRGDSYSFSVDWWSLGTMLHEMLVGLTPFWSENHAEMYRKVLTEPLQFFGYHEPFVDDDAKSLLHGMLQKYPEKRITAEEIRNHPYFSMLDWDHVYAKRYIPPYVPNLDANAAPEPEFFDTKFLEQEPKVDPSSLIANPAITENPERKARMQMPSLQLLEQAVSEHPSMVAKLEAGLDVFEEYTFEVNSQENVPEEITEMTEQERKVLDEHDDINETKNDQGDLMGDELESPIPDEEYRPWSPALTDAAALELYERVSSRLSRDTVSIGDDFEDWAVVDGEMTAAKNGGTLKRRNKLRRKLPKERLRLRTTEIFSRTSK